MGNGSVNGGKWVGKRWEMPISLYILYLKSIKSIKNVYARIFFGGKYVFFSKNNHFLESKKSLMMASGKPYVIQ